MSDQRTIYVAGYGRSGSTLLDVILSNHPDIEGLGEVTLLGADWSDPARACSCGKDFQDCERWAGLDATGAVSEEAYRVVRRVESRRSCWRWLFNSWPTSVASTYAQSQRSLLDHIRSTSGKPLLIDSSKSARFTLGRFLALERLAGEDVRVVHLVRSGLSTVQSLTVTGSNWEQEGVGRTPRLAGVRASIGWTVSNLGAALLGRWVRPGRYLRVRYEDLVGDPERTLAAIARHCEFDAEPLLERIRNGEGFSVGHQVGGNRLRLKGSVKLDSSKGGSGKKKLTRFNRLAFYLIGAWLDWILSRRSNESMPSETDSSTTEKSQVTSLE